MKSMQLLASLREAMSGSAKLLNPEGDLWVDEQLLGALHAIVNFFTGGSTRVKRFLPEQEAILDVKTFVTLSKIFTMVTTL